ncbi:MAG: BamA/TamA family outer membrane protein [Muribaculaceae bacterium]|nr:BamA/TamA family outer membrane protein [Muribaculaceae bacterium]MDE7369285.1 BamA/TamA family outer membrane protein [Muribaculaceae bacterium]
MLSQRLLKYIILIVVVSLLTGCSSTRHVPDGKYLLDRTTITVEGDKENIKSDNLVNYLRQTPNHKILGFAKLQLATYNLSGQDSTKWYNRWVRKIGQPPVIYDAELTNQSVRQLRQALINKGYNDVEVTAIATPKTGKKKMSINYIVSTGNPHVVSTIDYQIEDDALKSLIMADSALFTIQQGDFFDRNALDAERTLITERLRQKGYYAFTKDYITFIADTTENSKQVELTMVVRPPVTKVNDGGAMVDSVGTHERYMVRKVYIVTDYDAARVGNDFKALTVDSVEYHGLTILYGEDRYLRPSILEEKCFIEPDNLYNSARVDRTYEALGRLSILKYINISLVPAGTLDGKPALDAYILLSRAKKQGVTFELEGTNSEGDLGFGIGLTYLHRNLWKGSEMLTTKFRTSYESISGNFEGLINNRYTEYAGEIGLTFPKFQAPFLSKQFKQKILASSEVALSLNYQERPEYTRVIAGAGWKYKWSNRGNTVRRTFDLIDINFVYLPRSTINFIDDIAPQNPLLRYSYEDHFIMRMGYTYYRTNRRMASPTISASVNRQANIYSFRWASEIAGNLLYAISSIDGAKRHDGAYKIFGIQFAQYFKTEGDYNWTRNFDSRNSIALHAGIGVGVPYGNSSMIPFEKRFYAGGANGVRGWNVRTLGPGSYDARNSVVDFINQCGDIRFDMSFEYRAKLFWVFEAALFVDAGNIWTIRNYVNQPGGLFTGSFYKEIALGYGAGIRMDFTYFLLRLDLGLKAHNPARNQEPWPIIHPNWHRDATFHFAVGYPF